MRLEQYFDRIFVIHLLRRKDRREHIQDECAKLGWGDPFGSGRSPLSIFSAYDKEDYPPDKDGNHHCTMSHAAILQIVRWAAIPRTLILEDDFECRFTDTQERFSAMVPNLPKDWEMLYLGGAYGEMPQSRFSYNALLTGTVMTTSSYAVTNTAAAKMAPYVYGHGPIDSIYHKWNRLLKTYMVQPRLFVQTETYSELQQRVCENRTSSEDRNHEKLFPGGPDDEPVGSHAPDWRKKREANMLKAADAMGASLKPHELTRGLPTVGGVPL